MQRQPPEARHPSFGHGARASTPQLHIINSAHIMSLLPVSATLLAAGLAGLATASVTDIKERLISNEIVVYVLGVGVALRLVSTPGSLWLSLAGALVLLVVLGQFARFNVIGGGDAKLIAATMLLVPPQYDAQLMANIAVAGGALSCVYLAARIALRRTSPVRIGPRGKTRSDQFGGVLGSEFAKITAGEPMPYALAILAGAILSIGSEAVPCISATSCLL
jgi:prepilin peptidase CpaA